MSVRICAIAAMAENRVIGREGALPWRLPEDMRRFAALTAGHTVLMGRRTFESLPSRFKPLPERINIIATRRPELLGEFAPRVQSCPSAENYLNAVRGGETEVPSGVLWIAGGAEIYRATAPYWDEVYLTVVPGAPDGDAFFPEFEFDFELLESEAGEGCSFRRYRRGKKQTPSLNIPPT